MPRELLFSVTKKDLDVTWFSGKGAGGQNRNKCQNCCRIHHRDSGVIVTGQEERSRKQNLKNAFNRLIKHPKFKTWLRIRSGEAVLGIKQENIEINKIVDQMMEEKNLKIEYL